VSTGEVYGGPEHFEVTSLDLLGNPRIRVGLAAGYTARLGELALPAGEWVKLPLTALDKARNLELTVETDAGVEHGYTIATLPADFSDYTVTATSPTPGQVFFSANGDALPSYLFITDEAGKLVYYKRPDAKGYDFEKHGDRYAYVAQDVPQVEGVSSPVGSLRLLDEAFREIRRVQLLPHAGHGALPVDVHECVYLGDDHYILPAVTPENGKAVNIIQEVKDGEVVFEWDSGAFPEFVVNEFDYMHLNSIVIDPKDDNLIVSFRHQDQVVKLDRKTGTILWRLGGKNSDFPLTEAQTFSHQHMAQLYPDGSLAIFDNGNASERTRLLTFVLDEATHTVKSFDAFEPEARYSAAMGGFQRLDDATFFVGWGSRTTGSSDATEVNRDGQTTFALSFNNPKYSSYRALKFR
jgi:hypothetical protein